MTPVGLNETSLTNNSSSTTVPKLADNGSNWIDYKAKALIAMGSRGLSNHIDGTALKPNAYSTVNNVVVLSDGKTPASEEQILAREKLIDEFVAKDYLARYIIINSVSTRVA